VRLHLAPNPPKKISPSTPFQSSHAVRKVELDGFISSKGPKHRAIMEHDGSLLHSLLYELTYSYAVKYINLSQLLA
jgi:hypothetical protein